MRSKGTSRVAFPFRRHHPCGCARQTRVSRVFWAEYSVVPTGRPMIKLSSEALVITLNALLGCTRHFISMSYIDNNGIKAPECQRYRGSQAIVAMAMLRDDGIQTLVFFLQMCLCGRCSLKVASHSTVSVSFFFLLVGMHQLESIGCDHCNGVRNANHVRQGQSVDLSSSRDFAWLPLRVSTHRH
jgi:hypothetical protein